jgi:hypothetical protein
VRPRHPPGTAFGPNQNGFLERLGTASFFVLPGLSPDCVPASALQDEPHHVEQHHSSHGDGYWMLFDDIAVATVHLCAFWETRPRSRK